MELKESTFKDLFKEDLEKKKQYVRDVTIDTDVEMLIPDEYVSNIQERLNLYTGLNKIDTEEGIDTFKKSLIDRFGKMPKVVNALFDGLRLRWICKELGFERVILKNGKLRCYFVENPQSPYYESPTFQQIFQFIATQGHKHHLSVKKSTRHLILVRDGIRSLGKARGILQEIEKGIS